MHSMPTPRRTRSTTVRLKPSDPFDLIRLLARSQSDPRKAVCELVQNSLDAQAQRIQITWRNEHGVRVLRIWDDGRGVFPEVSREDALRRIATTIGHSHKRDLTPSQRRELMAVGKYGIGLIGFWCVGEVMEIKSRVAGSEVLVLRLERDKEHASLLPARSRRIDEEATYTEIVIREVLEGAERQIRPGRLQAYLASELRGQLLSRLVEVRIEDRVARGTATKHFLVRPQRFVGTLLREFSALAVPGHEDARLELYLVSPDEERTGHVQLACGGTTVLDDLALVDPDEGPRAPWNSGRIEGVVDFPELEVAPGTRRSFQRDEAAIAFLGAMRQVEMQLMAVLGEDDRQRAEQKLQNVAREIRRQFRRVAVELPEYDLLDVRSRGNQGEGTGPEGAGLVGEDPSRGAEPGEAVSAPVETEATEAEAPIDDATESEPPQLFPPGPLVRVRVEPSRLRLAPGASRRLRALALDADGRTPEGAIAWSWTLDGAGALEASESEAQYVAPDEAASARIAVSAALGRNQAEASVDVAVLAELAGQERTAGIPEPVAVNAPGERWRSRLDADRWEFNSGHRDYLAVQSSDARRVRYLTHLFAKEVVLRNFGDPSSGELLERMVEILTRLDQGRASSKSGTDPGA
jgi:hypothetical protein